MTEPSALLARMSRRERLAAGLLVYGLAEELAKLDVDDLARFGVVVAAQASGLMVPGEVGDPDVAFERLAARVETFTRACGEVDGL